MEAKLVIGGHSIRVLDGPYTDDQGATNEASTFGESLVAILSKMKSYASEHLLGIYNNSWAETDDDELTRQEFEANLTNPQIVIYDEIGAATVYFDDSDMFAGHSIEISVNNGQMDHAGIVG